MPVDAEPAALEAEVPEPEPEPESEPEFPVLPPPRVPSVPGPAPVNPGTVATWLVACADDALVPDALG